MQIYKSSLINLLKDLFVTKIQLKDDRIPAAVMVIIHFKDGKPYVILTKRSKHLKNHASQISFPGGIKRDDEEFIDASIREVKEELGISVHKNDVIGMLPSVDTLTSNFCIVPFIAMVDEIKNIQINKGEIDEVIDADLLRLLTSRSVHYRDGMQIGYKFEYDKHVIWGATARILDNIYNALQSKI